jgi:Tat protein secretion system quality control protein TatD with DNase activity
MHVLDQLASVRGEDRDELEHRIEANAASVFGLP